MGYLELFYFADRIVTIPFYLVILITIAYLLRRAYVRLKG